MHVPTTGTPNGSGRVALSARRLGIVTGVVLASAAAFAQVPPFLFGDSNIQPPEAGLLSPPTIRTRVSSVDLSLLSQPTVGQAFSLNLFPDTRFSARVERVSPTRSGQYVSATIDGTPWSEVTLLVTDTLLVGRVQTPSGTYTIRSAGDGLHNIREVDPEPATRCGLLDDETPRSPSGGIVYRPEDIASNALSPAQAAAPIAGAGEALPQGDAQDEPTEDGSRIDVLVVYTEEAAASQGGSEGMEALIDLWVADANKAYEDSGAIQRIALVHTEALDYQPGTTLLDDVMRLESRFDGSLDDVHDLRDRHAADLVSLIVGSSKQRTCGIAATMQVETLGSERLGFSVTAADCLGPVFAHELGHNMGLVHDRHDTNSQGVYPYSHGYVNAARPEPFKTIMASTSQRACPEPCPTLLRFSNAQQLYGDVRLGEFHGETLPGADARRSLDNTRRLVASFRSASCSDFSVTPSTRTAPSSGGTVSFSVKSPPGCLWDVESQDGFLQPTFERGAGERVVTVRVAPASSEREGTLSIAGNQVHVRQVTHPAGVCGRTSQVSDEITKQAGYSDVADCARVTDSDLARITELVLAGRGLTSLHVDDFRGLSNLSSLSLSANRISAPPSGLFQPLRRLNGLYMEQSGLRRLPENAFSGLENLRSLTLGRNGLRELPGGAFRSLGLLSELDLRSNNIEDLPEDAFEGLDHLVSLDLGRNRIASLPPRSFVDLARLEKLYLHTNRLTTLPSRAFEGLSRLSHLFVDNNVLSSLSTNALAGLESLRILALGSNHLTTLPGGTLAGLHRLEYLDLSNNRLASLPAGLFAHLGALEFLLLHGNRLRTLPPGIFDPLTAMETLWLFQNELGELPVDAFARTSSLKRLHLSSNRLTSFDSRSIAGAYRLVELDLSINRLQTLDEATFHGHSELTLLDLAYNSLETLPDAPFAGATSLRVLNMDGNRLTALPDRLFAGLSRLDEVTLDNNPGAPFPLIVALHRTDAEPWAPGPATLAARLAQGAPFAIGVRASATGGAWSADRLSIPAGRTASDPVTLNVSHGNSVQAALSGVSEVPGTRCGELAEYACFQGMVTAVGSPLSLFAEAPHIPRPAPDAELEPNGASFAVDLSTHFTAADGGPLRYAASSSDPSLLTALIDGSLLRLVANADGAEGTVTVTVTATDRGGRSTTWVLTATVAALPSSFLRGWRRLLLRDRAHPEMP